MKFLVYSQYSEPITNRHSKIKNRRNLMTETFRALIIEKNEPKTFTRHVGERSMNDLPEGDLIIKVQFSSLNYKDALSAIGNPGVSRNFPHTPGIDAAGTVVNDSDGFKAGDEVIVTGYDLGMNTSGGYGEFIRIPSKWAIHKPESLTLREAMILGTAGFTAAQSVDALETAGVKPEDGPIAVTGATGGVGSVAVAILAKRGYTIHAYSGKADAAGFLTNLGAAEVKHRDEMNDDSGRPMLRETFAGAVDTVGGNPLSTLLKQIKYGGAVTCCGLVAGGSFESSVFPFILRGVSLLGIDSVEAPLAEKQRIWDRLAADYMLDNLEELSREIGLDGLSDEIDTILKGGQTGRILVNLAL
ncbi:MAG: acrylyl-CoA reductase (NADPH) [Cellvibrionaceae bacterium]